MAGSFSDFIEGKVLDHVFGATTYTPPATLYLALYTATPGDASASGTEVSTSGTGYARLAVTNNTTNWPAASAGSKTNGVAFEFAAATASWGSVTAAAIYDAATAGNELVWGTLASAQSIATGNVFRFSAGDIVVTLD